MTDSPLVPDPARGALLSDHPHPHPWQRALIGGLVAAGLAGEVFGVIGLLVLAIGFKLPLMAIMIPFLLTLIPPLLMLSTLHPRVTLYEAGLWVQPLVWRGCWIPWEAVTRIEDHTLIRRGKTKDRQREHFGQLIVVEHGLTWPFAAVGLMAGLGWRIRAFGISTVAHVDYERLKSEILRAVER